MRGLVIIPLIPLQQAAKQHRTGNKDKICAHNHHQHRKEEQPDGGDGVLDGNCQGIRAAKQRKPEHAENGICTRRLLAEVLALGERNGVCKADAAERIKKQQKEDDAENGSRLAQPRTREAKAVVHRTARDAVKSQLRQLGKRRAREQPDRE